VLHGWEKLGAEERRKILEGIRDNDVYAGPFHADLSPTDACNYECFFCNSAFVDRSKRLPWEVMRRTLLETIGMGLKSIRLSGGGEPLIYPKIVPLLDLCYQFNIDVTNVTTNAFQLKDRVADRLLKLNTDEIIVSFNDLGAEAYAATNGTNERAYHLVIDNIRQFMAERRARGLDKPKVILQFFVWKGNHDRVEEAYDLGLDLGVDHIYLRDMWGVGEDKRLTPAELAVAKTAIGRLVERDRGAGKLILAFSSEKLIDEQKTIVEDWIEWDRNNVAWRREMPDRAEYCYIAWYSTVIRGNGEVYPCCILATTEGYPALGDVNKESFGEIWRGANYARLRDELRDIALQGGRYDRGKEHCFALEGCALRDSCPFVKGLATPEFYGEVHQEILALRRRPGFRMRRLGQMLRHHRPFLGAMK
jgi:MoaA/NifB/PqqE/SkfB family radical SAM enzyme